ncbi:MAG: HIT family protein [Myxococcota bacterium]|nr:HIT family protein [Myxococcota bacterium]
MSDGTCLFCAFAAGEGDAQVVYEDASVLAFLDHRPLQPGHVLAVPRDHVETLPELPDALLPVLFGVVRRLAEAVPRALEAEGSFVAINNRVSQSVPHLHVHVVPRRRKDGLRGFFWPRHRYRDATHAREVRDAIRAALGPDAG